MGPQGFLRPHLLIICYYIARYYVKKTARAPGGLKNISSLRWGEQNGSQFLDLFRLCPPPSLVGAYYLQPPDARAIFLHNDLLCNDMCSVTGGA